MQWLTAFAVSDARRLYRYTPCIDPVLVAVAPNSDPLSPTVRGVAVLVEPDYPIVEEPRGTVVIRLQQPPTRTRGEINNLDFRSDLLELARLLDHLAPDFHDPELFHVQKNALAAELRRLARWVAPRC